MALGTSCYTTARVARGRVVYADAHARRLARDVDALGLGPADPGELRQALMRLAAEAFAERPGIVRLEAGSDAAGRLRLQGSTRGLGENPATWRALCGRVVHPGPREPLGVKWGDHPAAQAGRQEAQAAQADEALLFDADGYLVEGARSCIAVAAAGRGVRVPPVARGGVDGIARSLLIQHGAPLEEGDVRRAELADADEVIALNAVRGARPIVALDGRAVGAGQPGPVAATLAAVLARLEEAA